ncbi:MAG: peptidoglycan DD-metalloendopeptidase family protein [Anaerolineales bacterium]|nr:peptidoglycan DD-metalloendopeptidase family protein [Anaerolineales bacterium]
MKSKRTLRAILLLILLTSLLPVDVAGALPANATTLPPTDMFQLPWDYGVAWMAIDGIDNGFKRPISSSHNYSVGGAIDFAPHKYTYKGEDTSNFWVAAAASGTVVAVSSCYIILDHHNGWVSQYQFLGNVQVRLGDTINRNQRLGIIADGIRYKFCVGSTEPDIPHLHFMLRPTLLGASFAGWQVNYFSLFNHTSFTKGSETVGLYKPLMNTFDSLSITPTPTPSETPTLPTTTETTLTVFPTPTGPYISTSADPLNINVGETALVTVSLNNVPVEGYTSTEIVCPYDSSIIEVSNISVANIFGTDPAVAFNGPQNGSFIVAIAGSHGNKATASGSAFTFVAKGLRSGQTNLECTGRVSSGNDQLVNLPSIGTALNVLGSIPTPTFTPTTTPVPLPSSTPTPVSTVDTWLTFTDATYNFQFKYPPQGTIDPVSNDNLTYIYLPVTPGTNLGVKYLEMIVAENANPCQSPLAIQSMLETSETVTINGLSFLKQTGQDTTAGHTNKWTAYSTLRDNICVSLDFILRAANPGAFVTPPPLYDEAAESAVFGQIVETYVWLSQMYPTSTPTPLQNGTLTGQVLSTKPVTINLYASNGSIVSAVTTNTDGTFTLTAPAGTYTTVASSSGFLNAQASVTLTSGVITSLTSIALLAGDIDGNNIIDQFDALTIGMNYNASQPSAADLNNDSIINVLDLERLAANYRKTGPIVWP